MALIVQKFGGSSVKDRDRIFNVARIVANTHNAGNDVVVVVSAQGDTTDDLITKAGEITHNPSAREMDMLLATGEQISISLLAMALNEQMCIRDSYCTQSGLLASGSCPSTAVGYYRADDLPDVCNYSHGQAAVASEPLAPEPDTTNLDTD